MPTLLNHTHCQVAQKSLHTDQNLSKSMAAPSQGQTAENKALKHNTRYKTLGVKWLFKRHLSHQSLLYLDSELAPNSPTISYRHPLPTSRENETIGNDVLICYICT